MGSTPPPPVLPLILLWLLVIIITVSIELSGWLLWLVSVISAILYIFVSMHVLHSTIKTLITLRIFGRTLSANTVSAVRVIASLKRWKYEVRKIAAYALLFVTTILVYMVFDSGVGLPFTLFFGSLIVVIVLRNLLPPGAVYLGRSTPERFLFLQTVQIMGLVNVTALLEAEMNPRGVYSVPFAALFDSRTESGDDWQRVVKEMIKVAPLILLDARDISNAVKFECAEVLKGGFAFKTVFVIDEGSPCPPLLTLQVEECLRVEAPVRCATEREIQGAILKMILRQSSSQRSGQAGPTA